MVVITPAPLQHNIDGKPYDYHLLHTTIQTRCAGVHATRIQPLRTNQDALWRIYGRCEAVISRKSKVKYLSPKIRATIVRERLTDYRIVGRRIDESEY